VVTRARFDPVVHEPTRLQMCGVLVAVAEAEFATLRDTLQLADSVTSKHLKALEHAGYVRLSKRRPSVGRPRTWVKLTREGRTAFEGHVAELQRLASLTAAADPAAKLRRPSSRSTS
jgi:predicted ArsR family transcriptional regulator